MLYLLYFCGMERAILTKLNHWKQAKTRKPLLLKGARQVGKTWVMKEFGRKYYEQVLYINFERDKLLQNLFKTDFDISRILSALQVQSGIVPNAENTLIIFDEIQEAEGALTALKYFQEEAPEYHIIGAGSLLGIALNKTSFPVGKVQFLEMHPMSFSEFLEAIGEISILNLLKVKDWKLMQTFHEKIVALLKQYYFVGGMPEAVKNYADSRDFEEVRKLQKDILAAYELDFSKHAPAQIIPKIRMVWNSLPSQLARENKKFIYGLVKTGARAREYEDTLNWLVDYGLIHRIYRITKPGFPIRSYEDLKAFKIFALDTGLLGALSGLDAQLLLQKNKLFTEFKGALTEQFILQQLISENGIHPNYWSNDTSSNEVDFIIEHQQNLYPLEVKAEENLQSKSLKSYHQQFE
ncbi:MAG TPA: ATP-binding protein, partial [Brumimicrobium sp.]|nr:ATP-binding protein [Brumimicrobium sp.]